MTSFSERWVGLYTRGLPADSREARLDEIASDVFEQHSNNGASERGLRMAIAGRTLRGAVGDLMWRVEEGRAMKQLQSASLGRPTGLRAAWATATQSWFTPLAVLVGIINLLFALYVILDENGKMPGQAIGPVVLSLFAVAMFTGLWLRWRAQFDADAAPARRARSSRRNSITLRVLAFIAVVVIAVGIVRAGIPFAGGVALLGAVAFVVIRRRRQAPSTEVTTTEVVRTRSSSVGAADVLIIVATLPSLAVFWTVIPPIVALVVIGGVIGTGPGTRRAATA